MSKFCPKCGSESVYIAIPQLGEVWECKQCGYKGPVILEDGNLAEKLKKEYKQ